MVRLLLERLVQKARLFAQELAAQRPENSAASLMPDTPEGRASALAIVQDAAMPPPEWSSSLERSRISLERQVVRLIEQVDKIYKPEPSAGGARLGLSGQADGQADVTDVAIVPLPPKPASPGAA